MTLPYWPLCLRPDGVEEPGDHAAEAFLLVARECEELVHRLGVRVRPALGGGRPVDPARVLPEGQVLAGMVAVDLGARGDQDRLAEAPGVLEDVLRSSDVGEERVPGPLDDQPHADGRGEVKDDVGLVHELADHRSC